MVLEDISKYLQEGMIVGDIASYIYKTPQFPRLHSGERDMVAYFRPEYVTQAIGLPLQASCKHFNFQEYVERKYKKWFVTVQVHKFG